MKICFAVLFAFSLSAPAGAEDKKDTPPPRVVVEPVDGKPVTVKIGTAVRLRASGVAGSTFTPKVDGKGQLNAVKIVQQVDQTPVLGADTMEYELTALEKGRVTLEVEVKAPGGAIKKHRLEITVE
ncbi:Uncharacterized protein OS=Blastopirellula marina DSM 3645 GN=DSM3645_18061 PE=4 SV=1 [Gemmata massiliana]|uniref:Uncharacterized protein n=1 Tax=Gemmata massiliana TaxID=1210884 RepID=A0A6P2DK16_9BACT|nr:hypothetical protein [Gemmata massiliana]VTS00713.1 Uncharacterized protein OS=Blastopirellula marina DSM 3645 GN=DSM3645_18061 PE=4 SV=1 [Gemmata massiliana]